MRLAGLSSWFCVIALFLYASNGLAQVNTPGTAPLKWYYPNQVVLQTGGNIGLLTIGPGYRLGKGKTMIDVLYGFSPKFKSESANHLLTGKFTYSPFAIKLSKRYLAEPLRIGTGLSYHFGKAYYTIWPDRYPKGYYWWTTTFRLTPFIGSAISTRIGSEDKFIKSMTLYGELGTHDLSILSWAVNKNISLWDITSIAVGVRLSL